MAIPKNLKREAKIVLVWYPKQWLDLKMIHDGDNVLTDDELIIVRVLLKASKHGSLQIRIEHPHGYKIHLNLAENGL